MLKTTLFFVTNESHKYKILGENFTISFILGADENNRPPAFIEF